MDSPKARVLRRGLLLWVVLVLIGASLACGRSGDSEPSSDEGAEDVAAESESADEEVEETEEVEEVEEEEEAGPSLEELVASVCSGQGVPEAAAYDINEPGPHPVVVIYTDGTAHSWNEELQEDWKAQDITSVELVICIEPWVQEVEECEYTDNSGASFVVTRRNFWVNYSISAAQTGEEIDSDMWSGIDADKCPLEIASSTNYIDGEEPRITSLVKRIQDIVEPPQVLAEGESCPPEYDAMVNPFDWNDPATLEAGKEIWLDECFLCHGPVGDGMAGKGTEPITTDEVHTRFMENPGEAICVIAEGRRYGTFVSPAYKDVYTPDEMWQVLTYMTTLTGW